MLLVLLLVGCSGGSGGPAQKYFCPMHPSYTSDRPGDCPICNMKLVLMKEGDGPPKAGTGTSHAEHGGEAPQFRCPDHPTFTFQEPGVCDEDGKPLQPLNATADALLAAKVPGRVAVFVAPEKQQLIGLRTTVVTNHPLGRVIRAPAVLEHDEAKLARIAPRFGGWVVDLRVNQTGQEVKAGEPLLTVYSPEIYAAENDYLIAWRRARESNNPADSMLAASRQRLALLGLDEAELRALEQTNQPQAAVTLRSPLSGHVIAKRVQAGQSFMAGEALFEIGSMTPLWARVSLPERDLAFAKVGAVAHLTLPALGDLTIQTKVDFIYPHLDPQTRRAQLRLVLPNEDHRLRPDLWGEVTIEAPAGDLLAVPASAVMDTGTRYVAFVVGADHHFEPRQLQIGLKTDDWWEVRSGVRAGEKVVTRALFLVDAESQLKAAIAGMSETDAPTK